MKISISQFLGGAEQSYVTFCLPEEGPLAKIELTTKMTRGFARSVSHWQFSGGYNTALRVGRLIAKGNYEDAAKVAAGDQVEM